MWRCGFCMLQAKTSVTGAAQSPDGQTIVSVAEDAILRVWNRNLELQGSLIGHLGPINGVSWAPNSRHVVTYGEDKLLIIWDLKMWKRVRVLRGHTHTVTDAKFNFKGNLIVSTSIDETCKVWDLRSEKCLYTLTAHSEPISFADFSYDGTLILTAAYDKLVRIWDIHSGICLRTLSAGDSAVTSGSFTPNAQFVVVRTMDGVIRIWDYHNKDHCLRAYKVSDEDPVSRDFIFNGEQLIVATPTGYTVFNYDNQECIGSQEIPGGVYSLGISDGHVLLGGPSGIYFFPLDQLLDPEAFRETKRQRIEEQDHPEPHTNGHAQPSEIIPNGNSNH